MATSLRKMLTPDHPSILGLLGLWAMFLATAVVAGLVRGDPWVFLRIGIFGPALLAAALALAAVYAAFTAAGIAILCRIASWACHRHLSDRFRFHLRGSAVRCKVGPKVEDRRRTAWGFLADALYGLTVGLGGGVFVCVPSVAMTILGDRPPTGLAPWLSMLGSIILALSLVGLVCGLVSRIASDALLEMAREEAATMPPPVDDEYS